MFTVFKLMVFTNTEYHFCKEFIPKNLYQAHQCMKPVKWLDLMQYNKVDKYANQLMDTMEKQVTTERIR